MVRYSLRYGLVAGACVGVPLSILTLGMSGQVILSEVSCAIVHADLQAPTLGQ